MTKEEKIARYSKLNQEVVPGKIAMANKAVQELAERHHAKYIDINDPLKDRDGNLKAEYTIEGMHIKEEGYRAIFDLFMGYAKEPRWNVFIYFLKTAKKWVIAVVSKCYSVCF